MPTSCRRRSKTLLAKRKAPKQLKLVYTSAHLLEAQQIRSLLEGNRIDAFIFDQHVIGLNPLYAEALYDIKVYVPADQFDRAAAVFKDILKYAGQLPMTGRGCFDLSNQRPQKTSRCRSCNAKLDRDARFCDQCGESIS